MLDGHCGFDNWEIILKYKGCNKQETRKYKLDTFVPHCLNKSVVDIEWI